ncbi:MAG: hypothetical protein C0506_03065 [Anaerolinea sp.]|nr:hypothetical protein [Anaerolinea sp.]
MPVTLGHVANWTVSGPLERGPAQHASAELRRALEPFRTGAEAGSIRLTTGPGPGDGFVVSVAAERVEILGASERGCLNGAYWLLEQLGFAWVAPGDRGERVAAGRALTEGEYREEPAFARRTLILGQDALHDDWCEWMEWASRNRLNDIFFHDTPPSRLDRAGKGRPADAAGIAGDGGGWLFERWDADGAAIVATARRRGMTVQFGGHHLPALLDRDLFDSHPDWFPLRGGRRDPRYNVCVSSEGARAHLRANARRFFERFSGADTYHLWADDIRSGGWCECGPCQALEPAGQALAATNVVAAALAETAPGARLAHLAYRDTLGPPAGVRPLANVDLLWAPRERCYAHAIADPECGRNRDEFWKPFTRLLGTFANDRSRVSVFEYYSDAVLFKWLAPPALETLPRDAAAYAAAGAGNLQDLMVGPRPWLGPPWHAWWMAKCAWQPSASVDEALTAFCDAAYPEAGDEMVQYYRAQDQACRLILDRHDLRPLERHDVLDFSDSPRETMVRKVAELRDAAARLDGLRRTLQEGSGWMALEALQAGLSWHVAAHLAHRLAAWEASLRGDGVDAGPELALATGHLEWLERWETESNSAAYANLGRPMLRAMRFHTGNIGRS